MKKIKLRLLPTIIFTAFVILIVRAHSYRMNFNNMPDVAYDSSTILWDAFSYAKSSAIFAITIYAAVTMAYMLLVGKIKIKKTLIYVPMAVYALCIVFSYIFSDYKWLAMGGSPGRFEGTRTILCYLFMLFYTINVIDEFRDAMTVVLMTFVSVLCACLIGVTQFLSHDFFDSYLADTIVTGTNELSLNTVFRPGQVYQTVANMNYVGMYLSLIVPILVYSIYYLGKKENSLMLTEYGIYSRGRRIIIAGICLLLALVLVNVAGAGSLGGVVGICVALFILLLVNMENKKLKGLLSFVAATGFVVMLAFVYMDGVDDHIKTGHKQIDYIETGIDLVKMSIDGKEISIIYDRDVKGYEILDADNNPMDVFSYAGEEDILQVDDDRFCGRIELIPLRYENDEAGIIVVVRDIDFESFCFTFYENGAKYLNPFCKDIALKKVDSSFFEGHLSAGSGRGFIWSRTIPLLRDRLLTGSGADTFIAVFPNNDYAGKYSAGMSQNITIDKPHNMYLGMAVGTGVVSVIAFITMAAMALWKALNASDDKKYIKVMAAGITGFLVAGLFNDSTVSIMPMFYGLLGVMTGLCDWKVRSEN